jgi:hypothetical protein
LASCSDFFGFDVAVGIAARWSFIFLCVCVNEVSLVLKNIFGLLYQIAQAWISRIDEVMGL